MPFGTRFVAAAVLLLVVIPANAGKIRLSPEQLQAQSGLIATGQVQSHREEDAPHEDGSVTRSVFLTMKVDAVEKGEAKPGDVIEVRCWVMVKEPRDGVIWDGGHPNIPGDGGNARFFLSGQSDGAWQAIYPNGIELLDMMPPLHFPVEKATPAGTGTATDQSNSAENSSVSLRGLLVVGGLILLGVVVSVVIVGVWLFVRQSRRRDSQ